ncbi:MAG: LCP family protein [Chloroflexi bacterium]|nr:LCP family protein [Chloroflexota bacterium]MCI0646895.1 LCP family protein [Chloroflexota bacterium]MCI0729100.1 LCP family protein [Chloroflexota bacterium]
MYQTRRTTLPLWLSIPLTITFIVTAIVVSAFVYLTAEAFLGRPLNPLASAAEGVSGVELPPMDQEGLAAVPTFILGQPTPTLIPTTEGLASGERVNILVMGIDRRPGEPFISRTDTMMLMSINPEAKTASILSIPRDLYVVIPGRGRDRINTAFVYGSAGNNPAGGALLAMQTVEYNLGVPIHHYVMVDFGAVIQGIDTIGGIDVYVPYDINDPTFPDMDYGFDPLYIPAGQQHFDGALALRYARTRHQDNDFYRARRQQQVVLAVRDKVLSLGITELVRQAPFLYQQLGEGVRTDLSLEEIIRLAVTAAEIPNESIRNEVLDQNYVTGYRTEGGASVLVLVNESAAPLIQELFYSN